MWKFEKKIMNLGQLLWLSIVGMINNDYKYKHKKNVFLKICHVVPTWYAILFKKVMSSWEGMLSERWN